MRCDMCQQESECGTFDIHGMLIDMCQECFIELQLEVISIEGLDKEYYILVFKKLGIAPKIRCSLCRVRFTSDPYYIGEKPICQECFDELHDYFF